MMKLYQIVYQIIPKFWLNSSTTLAYTVVYIHCMYIMYIYIYRERERERGVERGVCLSKSCPIS